MKYAEFPTIFQKSFYRYDDFYRPQTKLREGNIITSVCLFTGGSLHPGEVCIQGGLHPGGGGWADPTPHRILQDIVNERAVRILLERILV